MQIFCKNICIFSILDDPEGWSSEHIAGLTYRTYTYVEFPMNRNLKPVSGSQRENMRTCKLHTESTQLHSNQMKGELPRHVEDLIFMLLHTTAARWLRQSSEIKGTSHKTTDRKWVMTNTGWDMYIPGEPGVFLPARTFITALCWLWILQW